MTETSNYQKYKTGNPVMQQIIARFVSRIVQRVEEARPSRLVDLGCGEGMIARELAKLPFELTYRGLEIDPAAVAIAHREVPELDIQEADILATEPEAGWADVAICLEVLEHLPHPEDAVDRIADWAPMAIVSVPWEPFFRTGNFLRGKYVSRLGNHPEHIQQFGPGSLRRLMERRFRVVSVETCFPWLLAKAAAPR